MRRLTVGLVAVAVVFASGWQATAFGWYIPITDVDILPQNPTTSDLLTIAVTGQIGELNIPISSQFSSNGVSQQLNLYFDTSGYHVPVETSWSYSKAIGMLPANTYYLTVCTYDGIWPIPADTYYLSYTVNPAPIFLPGDANKNDTTDATDLNTVLSYYDQTGTTWTTGDFNGDHKTDSTDLNTVLSYYNQTLGTTGGSLQSAVPEPSSIAMLSGIALAALLHWWRKRA